MKAYRMNTMIQFLKSGYKITRPWFIDMFHRGKCLCGQIIYENTHFASSYTI